MVKGRKGLVHSEPMQVLPSDAHFRLSIFYEVYDIDMDNTKANLTPAAQYWMAFRQTHACFPAAG